ncbi:hypothetical protein KUCAC02_030469, partial [Chaenocephalus aceratus]
MQVYMYNSDDFDSLSAALREQRIIAAMAVFFQIRIIALQPIRSSRAVQCPVAALGSVPSEQTQSVAPAERHVAERRR